MSYHENSTLQVTDRLFLPIIVNSFSPADYWISLSFGIRRGSCSPLSSSLRYVVASQLVGGFQKLYYRNLFIFEMLNIRDYLVSSQYSII